MGFWRRGGFGEPGRRLGVVGPPETFREIQRRTPSQDLLELAGAEATTA